MDGPCLNRFLGSLQVLAKYKQVLNWKILVSSLVYGDAHETREMGSKVGADFDLHTQLKANIPPWLFVAEAMSSLIVHIRLFNSFFGGHIPFDR